MKQRDHTRWLYDAMLDGSLMKWLSVKSRRQPIERRFKDGKRERLIVLLFAMASVFVASSLSINAQRGSGGYDPQVYAGQADLARHRWASAASHFKTALQWDKNGVEAHIGLGEVYVHIGIAQRALDEYQAAMRLKPHSAEAERGIHDARQLSNHGEEEAAFQALEEQVKREPNNADVLTTYAEELVERNRLDEGRHAAEAALKINPLEGHAYCALGRIAAAQGRDADAVKMLETAVKHDNTDDDAISTLGDLAMKARDYATAIKYYRKVVQIVPDETDGHKKLLNALQASGDTRDIAHEQEILAKLSVESKP